MFTSRYLNNALNSIHKRALHLIYNDYELPFDGILEDNKQKSIHQKNIESLAIEIFKKEIKTWKCDACPCRTSKTYIQRVGFIN